MLYPQLQTTPSLTTLQQDALHESKEDRLSRHQESTRARRQLFINSIISKREVTPHTETRHCHFQLPCGMHRALRSAMTIERMGAACTTPKVHRMHNTAQSSERSALPNKQASRSAPSPRRLWSPTGVFQDTDWEFFYC